MHECLVQNRQKIKVFGEIWPSLGLLSKSIIPRNIHPMKLKPSKKRFLSSKRSFFEPFKKISKLVQNRQKFKVNPFTFCRNLAIFGTFSNSIYMYIYIYIYIYNTNVIYNTVCIQLPRRHQHIQYIIINYFQLHPYIIHLYILLITINCQMYIYISVPTTIHQYG